MNKVVSVPAVFRKTRDSFAAGAKTLPQRYFVSTEIFRQEQEQIFSTQWLLVGHQSQIADAGDYFLVSLLPSSDCGPTRESLIITRHKSGAIHGFYNVCRHRGTRLKEDACGHASVIQCPYHAWTYGLDGRLIGAPHMDEVPGFDKADYSLRVVNLGIWEGFIFVNLAGEEAAANGSGYKSLEESFAPLNGKFSHWNMSILRPAKRIEYELSDNWKSMV